MLNKVLNYKNPATDDEIRGYRFFRQTIGKKGYWVYRIEYKEKNKWYQWLEFTQEKLFLEDWNRLTSE